MADTVLIPVQPAELEDWLKIDSHIVPEVLVHKVCEGSCFWVRHCGQRVGVLRWNLFWDSIPFLTLIHIDQLWRGKGIGTAAMDAWEGMLRQKGHAAVMTSTQADEQAQFFYRKRGYRDNGCLVMDLPPYQQPLEILMIKPL